MLESVVKPGQKNCLGGGLVPLTVARRKASRFSRKLIPLLSLRGAYSSPRLQIQLLLDVVVVVRKSSIMSRERERGSWINCCFSIPLPQAVAIRVKTRRRITPKVEIDPRSCASARVSVRQSRVFGL